MVNDYFSGIFVNPLCSDRDELKEQPDECCACSSCSVPVMAYVPDQSFVSLYEPCEALFYGTLFKQLNKPFEGKGCKCCGR